MTNSDKRIDRVAAAKFLTDRGFPTTRATLAKLVVTGGGPAFFKWGQRVSYREIDLLAWAEAKLSAPVTSTSELRTANHAVTGSNNTETPAGQLPGLGKPYGGGLFAGVEHENGRLMAMVVAPRDSEIEADFKTAQRHCRDLRIGGMDDWRLPTRREAYLLADRLFPVAAYGLAQTEAAAFQEGGTEAFARELYWTGTEWSGSAWVQSFSLGYQVNLVKGWSCRVRAVRKCPL